MQYYKNQYLLYAKEKTYRYYTADCLQAVANNSANFVGGTQIKVSLRELMSAPIETDDNEAAEIIADLIEKTQALGGGNGECI